jgi:hypothetical protein
MFSMEDRINALDFVLLLYELVGALSSWSILSTGFTLLV